MIQKTKLNDKIAYHLTVILRYQFGNSLFMRMSITRVTFSSDRRSVIIYWDTFDNQKRGDLKKALSKVAIHARKLLSHSLSIRHTPELVFIYDSQYEDERAIEMLLTCRN